MPGRQEVIDGLKTAGRAAPTASVRLPGVKPTPAGGTPVAKKVLPTAPVSPSQQQQKAKREPALPEGKPWLVWGAVGAAALALVLFLLWCYLR